MNILGLIEKFLNRGSGVININSDFCVRLKTPMAGCYECIDRCPDLSIKITDNDIKILENCSNCNACLHICPNSVFYLKDDIKDEHGNKALPSDNKIYYFCQESGQYFGTAENKIKCIYEIGDIDIIDLLKKGTIIFFITGNCGSCRLKYFHDKKLKRINGIKKFINAEDAVIEIDKDNFDHAALTAERNKNNGKADFYGTPDIELDGGGAVGKTARKSGKSGESDVLGRREFFKNSLKGIKNNAKKIVEDISIEDLPLSELYSGYIGMENKNDIKDKKINKPLVERQKKIYSFLKENGDLVPLLNIRLPKLNENCVFCSNCWELCPTGALAYKEPAIFLEPFLCTGCNLCKDICSFGAVRMYRAKKLKDIAGKKVLIQQPCNI
jgi:Fe-S-cluster-containing hydrogenase component 2